MPCLAAHFQHMMSSFPRQPIMASSFRRRAALLANLLLILAIAAPLRSEDAEVEKVFAAVPFDQWMKAGPATAIPWSVQARSLGLTVYQRLRARIDVEFTGRDLAILPEGDRFAVLVQVSDSAGRNFRDFRLTTLKELPRNFRKSRLDVYLNFFVLPGDYRVTIVFVDAVKGMHNLAQVPLRVEPLKDGLLPGSWDGLPAVEFLAGGLREPDSLFHPDVAGKLRLPLATQHPVRLEVLADVTASDLFRGSTAFYNRYLSIALPLLKALSQISLERGSRSIAMLDLRRHEVTFEQEGGEELEWPRARRVLAPENGPATVDIKALAQRRESPAFLQDELLRRLTAPPRDSVAAGGQHVFVIIGSPMDFYSFRNLPHLPPGREERCVVYYLQFELLNPTYADGAIGNVRKMLKPLDVRVFKVRSPESIRHALARIVEEVGKM